MIFPILYFALGIVLVGIRFPRWFVAWSANEWPNLGWGGGDTLVCVLITIFAVCLWPVTLLIRLTSRISKITIHERLKDMHAAAKEKS